MKNHLIISLVAALSLFSAVALADPTLTIVNNSNVKIKVDVSTALGFVDCGYEGMHLINPGASVGVDMAKTTFKSTCTQQFNNNQLTVSVRNQSPDYKGAVVLHCSQRGNEASVVSISGVSAGISCGTIS